MKQVLEKALGLENWLAHPFQKIQKCLLLGKELTILSKSYVASDNYTVNSLVSDHPWGTAKWSLMGGGCLRERSTDFFQMK